MTDGKSLLVIIYKFNLMYEEVDDTLQVISIEAEWQMVSHYQLLYISLTLVYEEVGDTLQVISIEAEWQMVSHYQLLYISLTLVCEEVLHACIGCQGILSLKRLRIPKRSKSKKDRQYNVQKNKHNRTNDDLGN
jgi:hypothetical protein